RYRRARRSGRGFSSDRPGAAAAPCPTHHGGIDLMPSDRPIFVIGCPRSGTTMLQLMLHSHPRIAVPPETRFVVPAYFSRRMYGDMRLAENRRRLATWIATGKNTKF